VSHVGRGYGYRRNYGYGYNRRYRGAYYYGGYPYYYPWYYYPNYYSSYGYDYYPSYYSDYYPGYTDDSDYSDYSPVPYEDYPYSGPTYSTVSYPTSGFIGTSSAPYYLCTASDTLASEIHSSSAYGTAGHSGWSWTPNYIEAENQALTECSRYHANCALIQCFNYSSRGITPAESKMVNISVYCPEDAELFVDDQPTRQTGSERHFYNSGEGLQKGKTYTYTIRAELVRDGEELTQEREVRFVPGQSLTVTFDFAQPQEDEGSIEEAAMPTDEDENVRR
jgi:uncharacterized protein (TIGR03000 family)